jgi:hypothetical protein
LPKKTTTTTEYEARDAAERYASKLTWGTIGIATLLVTATYLFWTTNVQELWMRGVVMTGIVMIPLFAFWRTFWPRATRAKDIGFLLAIGGVALVMMQPDMQSLWKSYVFSVTPLGLASPSGSIMLDSLVLVFVLAVLAGWGIWRTKKKGRSIFP